MSHRFNMLLCFTAMIVALDVSAQEVTEQEDVLAFLSKASEANISLLAYGRIQTSVCNTIFDEQGQKQQENRFEAYAQFKDQKVRVDWKEQRDGHEIDQRTVATEEFFREYTVGDPIAVIREPVAVSNRTLLYSYLPSKNTAFASGFLEYPEERLVSRNVYRRDTGDGEVYVVEMVLKKNPQHLIRYYIDPTKGGATVKFETSNDYGKGHVLRRRDEAEMQPTSNGGWYLKRFTSVRYRPDGSLRRKHEVEIKKFDFVSEVSEEVFTWEGMGLPAGTTIQDRQMGGIAYKYGVPPVDDEIVYDVLEQPLVQETISQTSTMDRAQPEEQTVAVQEQPQETTTAEAITEGNDNKGVQASSSRSVYLLGAAGLALLLVVAVLVIHKRKSQAGGVE